MKSCVRSRSIFSPKLLTGRAEHAICLYVMGRMTKETKARLRETVLEALKAANKAWRELVEQRVAGGNENARWKLETCRYDNGTAAQSLLDYDVQRELGVTDAQVTRALEALVRSGEVEEVSSWRRRRYWRWVSDDLRAYRKRVAEERTARNARAEAVCEKLRALGVPAYGPGEDCPDDEDSEYVDYKRGSLTVPLSLMEKLLSL